MERILKSLEIEYNEMIDLALCTPAAQYKLLLIYTCAPLELILLDPNKGAKYRNFTNNEGIDD